MKQWFINIYTAAMARNAVEAAHVKRANAMFKDIEAEAKRGTDYCVLGGSFSYLSLPKNAKELLIGAGYNVEEHTRTGYTIFGEPEIEVPDGLRVSW